MITATKAGAWKHAVCSCQSLPSATFFSVSDTCQLTLSLLHSLTPRRSQEEGEEAGLVVSLGRPSFWVDRSLATSHRPQGDSEQRPLNQFILEIVFFLRQREEGGTWKTASNQMPCKVCPKSTILFNNEGCHEPQFNRK